MLDNHKTVCRALAPAGWAYTGFMDGFYMFQSEIKTGWLEMLCLDEDLTLDNLALMAKLNLSRTKGFNYEQD